MTFICLDCGNQFEEQDATITEYGTGAVLSKLELFTCPECGSTNIKDKKTGKTQGK